MIKVVTDSTAYLKENFIKENNIGVVPLKVSFGKEHFTEGINITPDKFYNLLSESKTLPKTSQPSVQDFIDTYKPILEKGDDIISIHISGGLSGTINAAMLAKKTLNTERICIIDSLSTAIVLQFLIESAIKLIKNGKEFKHICSSINAKVKKTLSRFTFYDYHYMVDGGRLNKAGAMVGTFLHIKPVISFTNGVGKIEGIARTWRKAKEALIKYTSKIEETKGIEKIGIHYGVNREEAEEFKKEIEETAKVSARMLRVGSVLGTYAGPKWVGIAIQTK